MNRILIFVVAVALTSCKSQVDQLLLSNDLELKEAKAQEYFENCEFDKAAPLFKDLIQSLSSSAKVEKVYFYYAFCDYKLEDYYTAAYEFDRLLEKFPKGKYAERCSFYKADCFYHSVPKHFLDQDYNLRAARSFQLFIETYPGSEFEAQAKQKLYDLRRKREEKAFENAKLYHKTAYYKSAIYAFQSVLDNFPDTDKAEEVKYLIVESSFLLADRSVESKKEVRFNEVEQYAQMYLRSYPSEEKGEHYKQVVKYQVKAKKTAMDLAYSIPEYYLKKRRYAEAIDKWKRLLITEKDQEKKREITDLILEAYYQQASNAVPLKKIEAVDDFLDAYESFGGKVPQNEASKWTSKNAYFLGKDSTLLEELAYVFLDAGDYKNSDGYFTQLFENRGAEVRTEKNIYNAALAKYKYAMKQEELIKEKELKKVQLLLSDKKIAGKGKVLALNEKVVTALSLYPKELVVSPMKRKAYSLAVVRAEQLIQEKNSEIDQEEIVYLLMLSSLKKAKSVRRYERLPWYQLANKKYKAYESIVKSEKYRSDLEQIKEKIDKGLTKYSKK